MTDFDVHLTAIAAGDPQAFGHWAAACETRLRLSLTSFAGQVDTEAVLQETLLRVWQVAPRVEPDGRSNSLLRFAIRVARNTAISELRRQRKTTPAPPHDEPSTSGHEPDPMLRSVIVGCREKLPKKPALALQQRLSSAGGEPDKVLATALDMTLNTFLQNITRARRLLAECLQRHGVRLEQARGSK